MNSRDRVYDLIIIGAGIGGVILLRYALKAGLSVLCLERGQDVGGLWRDLPDWQDIQTRKEDWSLAGIPIQGEMRQDIHQNIRDWALKFNLTSSIFLDHQVLKAIPGDLWEVHTTQGIFYAKKLVTATGAHNRPRMPTFKKEGPTLETIHSFHLKDPSYLTGKRVAVLGASASSFDIIDLAFRNNAQEVIWIYRKMHWMTPTSRPKYFKAGIRELTLRQMQGQSIKETNEYFRKLLNEKYEYFKMDKIMPTHPLDLEQEVLVAGRSELIKNLAKIKKIQGQISALKDGKILVNGEEISADLLIYCTGYEVDLSYLQLEKLVSVRTITDLRRRTFQYFKSIDYDGLYFFGTTILDSVSTTPLLYCYLAKTLCSHFKGHYTFPQKIFQHTLNHMDLVRVFAECDRASFPFWWELKGRILAWYYQRHQHKLIPLP